VELANAAAGIVVRKEGTAHCTARELRAQLAEADNTVDLATLRARLEHWRREGKRIVFTNGCYDILHRGHVAYLHQAKSLGDILVVGVNSDASIRRLKGPARPINCLEDRMHLLAALGSVDCVVPFDDDTPHNLIRVVRPHVFVKGGDYTRERLPEAALVEELGGVVRILPLAPNNSTTRLIERIRTVAVNPESSIATAAST
jgi:D-beta-D-heptose 7-phosphate kinase / D-beta-D-heptose 1-phosphate adenosyltransferase